MIPTEVAELTPEWFSQALGADIAAVEVLDAHTGTTGRARVQITTEADLPKTLFVKLQPFSAEQRQLVSMVGMGVAEARVYAALGDELPVRVPRVHHASYDESDSSFIMVLEDLEASGCRFLSAEDDDVLDTATALMDELAALHATYWGRDLPWIAAKPKTEEQIARSTAAVGGLIRSALDQFTDEFPTEFRELGELYIDRVVDINALYQQGERTLVHGDDHIGNLFRDASGRVGFYDWAIATSLPGMRDVSYFLANSLPTQVRRDNEQSLIARYRSGLEARGVTLDEETAWDQHRLYCMYSWSGATTTASMGSKWQPFEIGHRAMTRATAAVVDLDSLSLLRERLS